MAFLKPQITDECDWLEIDGPQGTEFVPNYFFDTEEMEELIAAEDWAGVLAEVDDCIENREIHSAEIITGYGLRLSAPGYTDCTPWEVYPSIHAANDAMRHLVADDE